MKWVTSGSVKVGRHTYYRSTNGSKFRVDDAYRTVCGRVQFSRVGEYDTREEMQEAINRLIERENNNG